MTRSALVATVTPWRLPLLLLAALVLCTGCGTTRFMVEEHHRREHAPEDRALVNFHRPSNWGGGQDFPIFDRYHLIGNLRGGEEFQYVCEPGEHLFIGRSEHVSVVKAHVDAGKIYDIIIDVAPGYVEKNLFLDPVHRDSRRQDRITEYEDREHILGFTDDEDARAFAHHHHAEIEEIINDFDGGPKSDRLGHLHADDCR